MPAIGVGELVAVETRLSAPFAATLNVLIWPLLEAIRKLPLGVAAREMPAQLSRVRPLENGEPGAGVKVPVKGAICITLIDWSPALATKRRFFPGPIVIRSMPAQATLAPVPPVENGEPGTGVRTPAWSTENPTMLLAMPL